MKKQDEKLYCIYGSRTGNSKAIAMLATAYARSLGLESQCISMDNFNYESLETMQNLIICVSTHGEGEPPVPAESFYRYLHSNDALSMNRTKYAVIGIGDSSYRYFCQTGADIDFQLEKLGANRIFTIEKCDIDFEEKAKTWVKKTVDYYANSLPKKNMPTGKNFVFELQLDQNNQHNGYQAVVLNKHILNGQNASHPTIKITFSLKNSGMEFYPGDLIGIHAPNSRLLVDKFLKTLKLDSTMVVNTNNNRKMLKEALLYDYELTVLTPIVLKKYAQLTGNIQLYKFLENEEYVKKYVNDRDALDMVSDFPGEFNIVKFLGILRKLTPRLYSAASYTKPQSEEVDLIVRNIYYQKNNRPHHGVSSSLVWSRLEPGDKAPVFVEANERFQLPRENDASVIMIATGTGIAPFRSYLQYRHKHNAKGRNWLFFGERNYATDFFFKDELMDYHSRGLLTKLDTAFSRDTATKHYIYHKLLDKGKEVFQWIQEGSYLFICGNKRTMVNDVRHALSELIHVNGNFSREATKEFISKLRLEKKLQEDVY